MTNSDTKNPKNPFKYFCEFCDYNSSNKKDYNRHLLTDKHKIMTNDDKKSQKNPLKEFACICGKKYKYRQGLSYHKKKCNLLNECTSLITIEDKKEIRTFNIDKMWGLGTPEDLRYYLENYK